MGRMNAAAPKTKTQEAANLQAVLALAAAPFGVAFPYALAAQLEGGPVTAQPEGVQKLLGRAGFTTRKRMGALPEEEGVPLLAWKGMEGPWLRRPDGQWFTPDGAPCRVAPSGTFTAWLAIEAAPSAHNSTLAWFWQPFRGQGALFAKIALWGLVVNLAGLMVPLFSMAVYDRVMPVGATRTLWLLVIGILLVLGLDIVLRLLRSHGLARILARAGHGQDDAALGKLLRQKGLDANPANQLDQLRTLHELREQVVMHILPNLADIPMVVVLITVIGWLEPALLAVPLTLLVFTLLLQLALLPGMARAARRQAQAGHARALTLFELLRSGLALRLHNRQNDAHNHWQVQATRLHSAESAGQVWQSLGQHITITVAQLSFVAVLVAGTELVISGGMTVGVLIACSMLCSRAMTPALHLVDTLVRIQKVRAGLAQLKRGFTRPFEVLVATPESPDTIAQCRGDVQLQGVGVSMAQLPGHAVLTDISLHVQAGECWGVVGSNGAGKSTLLHTLVGLVEPDAGHLRLDGIDYSRLPVAEVRRHVVLVPQTPHLPDAPVREVIAGLAPVDENLMQEALAVSGFAGVLKELGVGLEYRAGPDGARLSGGQRQMLALALAVYRQPRVLLLDEPTSALDPDAEQALTARLHKWVAHRRVTLLLVTHRVHLLELVQHMVVLAQGRIVMAGPRKEVVKRLKGGVSHA